MKKILATLLLLIFSGFLGAVRAGQTNNKASMDSDTVVWAGLDYSMLHIIGNTNEIKVPDMIFQDMPQKWNDLFVDERLEGVATSLNRRVLIDLDCVAKRNKQISPNPSMFAPDSENAIRNTYITLQDITNAISSYKMKQSNGLGLVFIIDSMIYHRSAEPHLAPNSARSNVSNTYVVWGEGISVVFFDIATHEIISCKRTVKTVSTGGSFRFFWFGPVKDTDSELYKYRFSPN